MIRDAVKRKQQGANAPSFLDLMSAMCAYGVGITTLNIKDMSLFALFHQEITSFFLPHIYEGNNMFFFRYSQTILTTISSQRIVPMEIPCQRIVLNQSKNCPYPVKELSLPCQRIVLNRSKNCPYHPP